jgi:hypothetical protein
MSGAPFGRMVASRSRRSAPWSRHPEAEVVMRSLAIGMAVLLCMGLSACAGSGGRNGVARSSYDGDIDYGKVIAVNQWALRRHATVMWVNYPTRPERLARNDG